MKFECCLWQFVKQKPFVNPKTHPRSQPSLFAEDSLLHFFLIFAWWHLLQVLVWRKKRRRHGQNLCCLLLENINELESFLLERVVRFSQPWSHPPRPTKIKTTTLAFCGEHLPSCAAEVKWCWAACTISLRFPTSQKKEEQLTIVKSVVKENNNFP